MRRGFAWRKFGRRIVIALGIVLVSALLAWGVNSIFTIRNVEVSGEGVAVSIDQTKLPKNLLFFPTQHITAQILQDYPLVGMVVVKKKYPSTLVITAVPRKAFAIAGVGGEIYAVDEDGVVITQYPTQTGLPAIRIPMPPMPPGASVSDPAVAGAIRFLRETASIAGVSQITAFDSTSLQAQGEGMSIRFVQDADMPALARTLQTVVAGFRIKGKLPQTIDLRFDKPVVTF